MIAPSSLTRIDPRQRQALKLKVAIEQERRRRQLANVATPLWQPSPGPQTLAYNSPADILGYGGAAGGGKTDLALGLAATQHKNSAIFRRVSPNLRGIIERSREVFNPDDRDHADDRFNETLHRWMLSDGRTIELESCQLERHKENQRGRPRDFYAFDEATEFTRSQVEFIIAWLRSTNPNQRKRVLLTFNPPMDSGGSWVVDYFLPWLAFLYPTQFKHPNPAAPGELRWYRTEDGRSVEYAEPVEGAMSRTFIPAKLQDNPYLRDTNYGNILNSLPEPLRSQLLHGDFSATAAADPWQVIPTAWVKLAQARWMERERPSMPCSGVGVDVARGGGDKLVVVRRYGTYFDEATAVPGVNVEDGPKAAALVAAQLTNEPHIGYINVDVIGVGTSAYDSLKAMYPGKVQPISAANASSYIVGSKGDKPGGQALLKMRNVRAEYYWRMREALDPEHGVDIALPPGNEIVADLCAARWQLLAGGVVQIEPKDKIKERIGRSPDVGEAIMFALAGDYGVKEDDKTVSDWVAI